MAVETVEAPGVIVGKLYQGVAKNEFGYKMMAAMGWSEGKGLGAKENGITKHVSVKKRIDLTGIGADLRVDDSARVSWCANTVNYEQVLANLQAEYAVDVPAEGTKKKKKKAKGKKGGGSPDASGEGKSAAAAVSSDSSDGEDVVVRTRLRPQENARGRPQGRYKKREMGKMVKGYSATDLNMILGVAPGTEDPFAAMAAAAVVAPQRAPAADDSDDDDEEEQEAPKAKKAKKSKKNKKGSADVGAEAEAEAEAGEAEERRAARSASEREATVSAGMELAGDAGQHEGHPPEAGWWGEKMFVWSGVLGSIRQKKRERGFDELEQERVYTEAHEQKMQNRQGLGQKDRPKKVAGATWKGKKMTFGEGDDEEAEGAAEGDGEVEMEVSPAKGGKGKKARAESEPGGIERTAGGDAVAGAKNPDKVKWKRLSEAALSEAGGSMKLSALQRAALTAAGVKEGSQSEGIYLDALMRRLKKSSRFEVGAKRVKLVAGAEGADGDD